MLGKEDRVSPHRSLPPVVERLCGGEPFPNEVAGMDEDGVQPSVLEVQPFLLAKPEAAAEWRIGEV